MVTIKIFFFLLLGAFSAPSIKAAVTLTVNGLAAQIKNEFVELNFGADAAISTLLVDGQNIAATGQKTFYLDWNSGVYGQFSPKSIHVVEQTANRAHFYWVQDNIENVFNIELHYIMVTGLKGIYSYAKYRNDKSYNVGVGETRIVYRFAPYILTQGTNQQRTGTTPLTVELDASVVVQDSTWQFPNGTYYSKYDYAAYIRETNYQGVYGNGFGAFVISPSREYHGGGPLKQDLTVHQECLVANYFLSGHLVGTPALDASPGWQHLYGPFLIYFPTGDNGQIMEQVVNQVEIEQSNWPYAFVQDDEYPRLRGTVSGIVSGQKHAMVVVWDSEEDFDIQQSGYLYHCETDASGYYSIKNVRPGTYRIAAYPLSGYGSENVAESEVTVTEGGLHHVGLTLPEPENIVWALGEANRRSNEFKYADQPRNYQWEWIPPVENTFIIGVSDPKEDWYYAQSQPGGSWYIKFQDSTDGNTRTLRVALAAASQKTHLMVYVNGHMIGNEYFDNDQAIYRSAMQSGRYHSLIYTVQPVHLLDGENTIQLFISLGQIMYDTISWQKNNY